MGGRAFGPEHESGNRLLLIFFTGITGISHEFILQRILTNFHEVVFYWFYRNF